VTGVTGWSEKMGILAGGGKMSIENPFSINTGWKIDPDNRQDRGNGPVITRQMTKEEKIKYGIAVESEEKSMKITKENVRQLAASGMSAQDIVEYFKPLYPKMKDTLIKAKVALYLSDKPGGGRPLKIKAVQEPLDVEEESSIQEVVAEVKEDVAKAAAESADRITIRQIIEEYEIPEPVPDNIEKPAHYTAGGIETINYIKVKLTPEQFEGFCIGSVIKYVSRYRFKGGLEDLKKAAWYLNKIISIKESA